MQKLNEQTKSRGMLVNDPAIRLYKEIASLSMQQQLYILNRLFMDTLRTLSSERHLDITGLRGLGKEIWQGLDAQEYVNRERDSWD
jgi:hypothetical protein